MGKFLIYLLESSVLLALFYLIYSLVLRRETFFSLNRFFLLGILPISLLFPLLSFDFNPTKVVAVERPMEQISKLRMSYYEAMALWEYEGSRAASSNDTGSSPANRDWIKISSISLLVLYAAGIMVCLSRTFWSLRWIWKTITIYPRLEMDSMKIIRIPMATAPFSFFHFVFVHDDIVGTPEFDQILAHERTHVQQKHSIDLIIVQLLAAFFWFNPVIWRLIKSLKTTHEYIADKKTINSGYSLVEYQTLLLKQLISNNSFGLVHNFNLSFIKKRITMMTNKQSGWSGKVKVAVAIAVSLIGGAVIIQCNSRIDEQVSLKSELQSNPEFTQGINLPRLPETGYTFKGDPADALNLNIVGNKLSVDGKPLDVNEIGSVIKSGGVPSLNGHVVLRVDKDQSMGFVREVQMELRKADRRKIQYLGQTDAGAKVESAIFLPPTLENATRNDMPTEPDISALEAEGKLDILKIDLGDNAGAVNQQMVYDFVKSHMAKQSTDYVVAARFDDSDTYNAYLVNLAYVKEGFYQIYQERAHEMFGKDYFDISKEEFNAVRKGVPMAISISEK